MDAYGFSFKGYQKETVTAVTQASSPYVLTANQSGQVFTTDGASGSVQFNLPTLTDATTNGLTYTFVKLAASSLVIDTAAGDYVADSSSGGQIQNTSAETYATVTLTSVSTTQWVVAPGAHGTWVTV